MDLYMKQIKEQEGKSMDIYGLEEKWKLIGGK